MDLNIFYSRFNSYNNSNKRPYIIELTACGIWVQPCNATFQSTYTCYAIIETYLDNCTNLLDNVNLSMSSIGVFNKEFYTFVEMLIEHQARN